MAAGRIISIIIVAGGWLLTGARLVLDLIGYSTAPEDIEVAKTRLVWALELLVVVPWQAFFAFALISTLWLMWVSWPRYQSAYSAQKAVQPTLFETRINELPTSPEPIAQSELSEPVLIPLIDFARKAYEETRGSVFAQTAEENAKNSDDILRIYATSHLWSIPIYGATPPSRKLERIPRMKFNACDLHLEDGTFLARRLDGTLRYDDIHADQNFMEKEVQLISRIA